MTRKTSTGFTLIELMIVVVIIGVLAAIAYPAYTKYARETRRSDGQIALAQLANDMEKFFSECGSYAASIDGGSRSCTTPAGGTLGRPDHSSPAGYYTLKLALPPTAGVPTAGFLLTATPAGIQTKDIDCTTLTLTNTGTKGATGANTTRCWRK
jgi:type IV pilus assembly protein PilE